MAQTEAAQHWKRIRKVNIKIGQSRCVDCNENFIWTAGEQVFFHDKGLKNEPKRCKPCKQAKNERLLLLLPHNRRECDNASKFRFSAPNADNRPPFPFIHLRDVRSIAAPASLREELRTQKSAQA